MTTPTPYATPFDRDTFRDRFIESDKAATMMDQSRLRLSLYHDIDAHYQAQITPLLQRISDLEHSGNLVIAHLIELKQAVRTLSEKLGAD